MRIVMSQYADGDVFAVETTNDGSEVVKELLGRRKVGARVSAYAEVACDDTAVGLERLQQSLDHLLAEVRQRREQPAGVGNPEP